MKDCTLLDQLPEPLPPVKYPRTPGYRPSPQENSHNAWLEYFLDCEFHSMKLNILEF